MCEKEKTFPTDDLFYIRTHAIIMYSSEILLSLHPKPFDLMMITAFCSEKETIYKVMLLYDL